MPVLSLLVAMGLVLCGAAASAATVADLARIGDELRRVAAPWCGRLAVLDAQGRRTCTVSTGSLGPIGAGNAIAFLGETRISDELLAALTPAELAAVVGHEFAHLVLGHALVNTRRMLDQMPAGMPAFALSMVEATSVEPHEDTPTDLPAMELDADALGLYFAGLAGYPVHDAALLWRDASRRIPGWESRRDAGSHPTDAQRLFHAREAADVFCTAQGANRPPLPAEERLLPHYELSRDELIASLDQAAIARACGIDSKGSK